MGAFVCFSLSLLLFLSICPHLSLYLSPSFSLSIPLFISISPPLSLYLSLSLIHTTHTRTLLTISFTSMTYFKSFLNKFIITHHISD